MQISLTSIRYKKYWF